VPTAHSIERGGPIVPDIHKTMPIAYKFRVATPIRKWINSRGE
jgi:hypothetical protein